MTMNFVEVLHVFGAFVALVVILIPITFPHLFVMVEQSQYNDFDIFNCLVVICVASTPLILHLLWDLLELRINKARIPISVLVRAILLSSFMLALIICLAFLKRNSFPLNSLVSILCAFISSASSCSISIAICMKQRQSSYYPYSMLSKSNINAILMSFLSILYLILRCVSLIDQIDMQSRFGQAANYVQLLYHAESCVVFFSQLYWQNRSSKADLDDTMVNLFLGIFVLKNIASSAYTISTKALSNVDFQLHSSYICTDLYVHLVFMIIVMTVPARYESMQLVQYLLRAVDEKVSIIRYICHEMRTPLNIIHLSLGFVESETIALAPLVGVDTIDPMLEAIGDINESCDNAVSVLDDLLTIDKMQGNKYNIELEDVRIIKYLKRTCRQFSVLARQHEINFEFVNTDVSDCDLKTLVRIDRHKIAQVGCSDIQQYIHFLHSKVDIFQWISIHTTLFYFRPC